MPIRVCHVVASLNEHTGGPAHSVAALTEGLVKQHVTTHLIALDYPELGAQIIPQGATLHSLPATILAKNFRGLQVQVRRTLSKLAATELDVIHNHGVWMVPNIYARRAAKRNHIPLVTSPRGMLEPWALGYSKLKKAISWHLYERSNLESVAMFHATSSEEVNSIRLLGFRQPVALIQNGVSLPSPDHEISRKPLCDEYPALKEKRWLLSLSRIHPKKGFDNLLHIWSKLRHEFNDWHLIIAGSDLIGYQAELQRLIHKLGIEKQVTMTGPLTGLPKKSALFNADLFVLPSHSENFGIVIGESLAHGVPVVTTRGTPWQELESYKCGWWVDDNRTALTNALRNAMKLTSNERQRMGQNGRALIERKFSWDKAAKEMTRAYSWLLDGGPRPDFIDA